MLYGCSVGADGVAAAAADDDDFGAGVAGHGRL